MHVYIRNPRLLIPYTRIQTSHHRPPFCSASFINIAPLLFLHPALSEPLLRPGYALLIMYNIQQHSLFKYSLLSPDLLSVLTPRVYRLIGKMIERICLLLQLQKQERALLGKLRYPG